MIYPYSSENRLQAPHAYMYTPYFGLDFLIGYVHDRRDRLTSLVPTHSTHETGLLVPRLVDAARAIAGFDAATPSVYSPEERTELQPLLAALLSALAAGDTAGARPWVARIIQRFEVSKKLYSAYAPGFRKGEGSDTDPARYAQLALCLALAYARSGHLQYLSTLLKLTDLLLSLGRKVLGQGCSGELLGLLVDAELDAVQTLAAAQGVNIDVD